MADLKVTNTGKDRDGDILSLCGLWGKTWKETAIWEIESGRHRYYVQDSLNRVAIVQVVNGFTRKYLRSDPNSSCSDNLDSLPPC